MPSGLATVYVVSVVSSVATTFLPVFSASRIAHALEPLACRAAHAMSEARISSFDGW
ncbi:hypothetical protein [Streptomyces sp. SMS_SU21]|uniref:hypothetical protein n=1 Tax=Streptomyces sp. SMS_SU21 TaxID=2069440 RepID=UPI001CD927AF|nr:hypothetical protein [Streptomyces sp. SMS_SU21]MCA2201723.1 hypothetical protein [Streptomyces sp. SMS_SU21]